jgi:flagellar basal-body rod protein FlgB
MAKVAGKSDKIPIDAEPPPRYDLSETKSRTVTGTMASVGLERSLDVLSVRAKVLAGNLANANTPNFLRRDVPFHAVMRAMLSEPTTGDKGRGVRILPVQVDFASPLRADGNNTSPERELAALTETALLYRTTLQLLAKDLSQLRAAITEGRRS